MKKFLSLVLALVMTMSLVTISAGAADFTDDDSITYKEAVDVMTAIGVVDGYTDGAFQPQNPLNRGQAAKIICNLILGPTTASALAADAAPFKDVPANHVFAGYIAYCAQQGIINGYADGTFRPAATLTGNHFMKMLLGALGYDGDIEGFTGGNWTIPVAKLALGNGLDDGLVEAFNGDKVVTREEACLFALNTLQATMVQYDSKSVITVGDVVISSSSKAEPVDQYGYKDIYESDKTEANQTLQFGEKYFPKLTLVKDGDALARKSNTWTYKNKEVGTYATEDAILVYTKDMSSTSGKAEVKKALKGFDLSAAAVYHNGQLVNATEKTDSNNKKYTVINGCDALDVAEYTGNGILVEVYADGTDVERVVVIDSYVGKVSKVNKTDETITIDFVDETLGSFTTEKGYDVFEKDTYVMVSPVYTAALKISKDSSDMDEAVVVAAKMESGKVTTATSSKVVLDETDTYKAAEINSYSAPELKDEVNVYLDAYGFVVYCDKVAAKDFVYAVANYTKDGSWGTKVDWVQLVTIDGTELNYQLHKDSKVTIAGTVNKDQTVSNKFTPGKLYSYSITGGKIKLTEAEVATGKVEAYVTYVDNQAITSSTNNLGNRYFADETVFVSVSGTLDKLEVTVGTGKQLVEDKTADYAIICTAEKKSTSAGDIAVVFVNKAMTADSVKGLYLISDADPVGYAELNDTDYDTYEVYVDGEKQTVPVDDITGGAVKGKLYTASKNSDGAYKLVPRTTNVVNNTLVGSVYSQWLNVAALKDSLDTSDAEFVDLTDNGIDSASALKDLVGIGGAEVYVSVVFNADNEASIVYVTFAKMAFTAYDGDDTYVVNSDVADDFNSISYKENGVTKTIKTMSFSASEFKSVKVSTIDGSTFEGYVAVTSPYSSTATSSAAAEIVG